MYVHLLRVSSLRVTSGVKIQISGLTMIIAAMLAINGLDMHGWVEGKPTEWNMDT